MMKLYATFLKDMKMAFRSFYIYIEVIMALIFVAVLIFAVPENFTPQNNIYLHVQAEDQMRSKIMSMLETDEMQGMNLHLLDSAQAVREQLVENRDASGLLIGQKNGQLTFEFVLQGYESSQVRSILEKSFLAEQTRLVPGFIDQTTVTTLAQPAEKLPDRINLLPIFLVLNSALIGLFIIASYIFIDKDEGTIRAYAVTPARIWQYLLSKVGMMLVTGLITGLLTVMAVAGSRVHVFHFIIFMAACNIFGSALGLLIASFFDSMTKSLGWLYIVIIIMSFASISYMMPSFSPLLIRMLPAYPMLFAFRQTLLTQPDYSYITFWALVFTGAAIVLFLLANLRFKKTLTI